jgi:hypothetical protein
MWCAKGVFVECFGMAVQPNFVIRCTKPAQGRAHCISYTLALRFKTRRPAASNIARGCPYSLYLDPQ